jgi:hypothetical protein
VKRPSIAGALCAASVAWLAPGSVRAESPPLARVVALLPDGAVLESEREHLAMSHEIPRAFTRNASGADEHDAVRLVFVGFSRVPSAVELETRRRTDEALDVLHNLVLSPWPCPVESTPNSCWSTLPVRLTPDRLDRDHPAVRERSLEAELGGQLQVAAQGQLLARFRIGGPRVAAFAGLDRLSARVRMHIVRVAPGGAPAIGTDDASARRLARAELTSASKLWAQCGVDLNGPSGAEIEVVDPPPTHLLAVGCEAGLPASGGEVTLEVAGHRVHVSSRAGEAPLIVAERLSRSVRALGFRVALSPNPRTTSGASGSVDVLVQNAQGRPVALAAAENAALSSDATLAVCLGEVDLGNGLSHFVEADASAGTLEERALIKAFDDGDPSTVDVFVVPSFDQSGRIGESFIDDDGAAIQNTVIIDRAAVRAGPRSYALAHEIGHILLDMPGHPDDYGVDHSSSLMDADAADASVFGPRRLSLADCERALRESGPNAKVPLLTAWPIEPPRPTKGPTIWGR